MKTLRLTTELPDAQADALAGSLLDESSFDTLVREDEMVFKPNGELLLMYRKDVLPGNLCTNAYKVLRHAAHLSRNRGMASGEVKRAELEAASDGRPPDPRDKVSSKVRYRPVRQADGRLSNTNHAVPVNSGIVGYFDRAARFPYCRQTAFTMDEADKFLKALPFIQAVSGEFETNVPDRFKAQMAFIGRTNADFVIPGTAFTTVTVNKNWQTAVHKDAGDLKQGSGVMAVLQAGTYEGAYLCFPKYRVAVDMRLGGVCFADVHEWHGNTPIVGKPGRFERISCVFYYRERMHECGSSLQEAERAKRRRRGAPLHGAIE